VAVFESLKFKEVIDALDTKWTIAFAAVVSTGALLYLHQDGNPYLDDLPRWLLSAFFITFVVSAAVSAIWVLRAIGALGHMFWKGHQRRRASRRALEYLDSLNDIEREVLSYCVMRGEQSFATDLASSSRTVGTLIQKGIVIRAGGSHSVMDWPHTISPVVWKRLQRRAGEFTDADPGGFPPYRTRVV
jgi:hypothetical protein